MITNRCQHAAHCTGPEQALRGGRGGGKKKDLVKKKDPRPHSKDQQKALDKDPHGAGLNKSVTTVEEGGKQNQTEKTQSTVEEEGKQNKPETGNSFLGLFGLGGKEKDLGNKTDPQQDKDESKKLKKDKNGTLEEGGKQNQTEKTKSVKKSKSHSLSHLNLGG